jgi:hypothetical protein
MLNNAIRRGFQLSRDRLRHYQLQILPQAKVRNFHVNDSILSQYGHLNMPPNRGLRPHVNQATEHGCSLQTVSQEKCMIHSFTVIFRVFWQQRSPASHWTRPCTAEGNSHTEACIHCPLCRAALDCPNWLGMKPHVTRRHHAFYGHVTAQFCADCVLAIFTSPFMDTSRRYKAGNTRADCFVPMHFHDQSQQIGRADQRPNTGQCRLSCSLWSTLRDYIWLGFAPPVSRR